MYAGRDELDSHASFLLTYIAGHVAFGRPLDIERYHIDMLDSYRSSPVRSYLGSWHRSLESFYRELRSVSKYFR